MGCGKEGEVGVIAYRGRGERNLLSGIFLGKRERVEVRMLKKRKVRGGRKGTTGGKLEDWKGDAKETCS